MPTPKMLLSSATTSAVASGTIHPHLLHEPPRFSEDIDVESNNSTPFVSAPSSPTHGPSGYFFSAPASPMHFLLSKNKPSEYEPVFLSSESGSFEFEFSSRFSPNGSGKLGSMTSADELFINGQIRPMIMFTFGEEDEDEEGNSSRGRDLRMRNNKYAHRKARSMSPLRTAEHELQRVKSAPLNQHRESDVKEIEAEELQSCETTPSCSASSSRSSSSGRNSKKWIFLKELLHRSKSEGRANNKERFWSSISFLPAKEKHNSPSPSASLSLSPDHKKEETVTETEKQKKGRKVNRSAGKPANGLGRKRREAQSAHELHYTANRAQSEEMKKKTFLPYRQGLLGCLGFGSKSYSALSGFTRIRTPSSNS